ncbi:MAG: hypothetical protein KDK76_03750 [Chlamydiia bacterium]|nr:hypothetical protein [Chlamydiia bacterium]
MMTPEESAKEQREFAEDKALYPPFIVEELKFAREQIRLKAKTGKSHQKFSKITDFTPLILSIWVISNNEFQERFWVRQEPPILNGDNYMETLETFLGDARAVLEANQAGRVSMTPKQREMLQKLYDMVDGFDGDPETPDDPGHGANDAEIIQHPKWHKIQKYARLVYEEISGDDLDAWERSRPKPAKPAKINYKEMKPGEYWSEIKKIYPQSFIKIFERQAEDQSIKDFYVCLLSELWEMSSQDFQERFWDRKEYPIYDNRNCMKTLGEFLNDTLTLLIANRNNTFSISPKQEQMLQKLSSMVKAFKEDPTLPDDPGYGLNDGAIIQHPEWHKIREYARLVYEELSGDRLDQSKSNG